MWQETPKDDHITNEIVNQTTVMIKIKKSESIQKIHHTKMKRSAIHIPKTGPRTKNVLQSGFIPMILHAQVTSL